MSENRTHSLPRVLRLVVLLALIAATLSAPTTTATAAPGDGSTIVVVSARTPAPRTDARVVEHLTGAGYHVVVVDDDESDLAAAVAAAGADAVLVSASVAPFKVGSSLRDLPLGIGIWEALLFDDFDLASGGNQTYGTTTGRTSAFVHAGSHPIAGSLSGTVKLTRKVEPMSYVKPAGGTTIATLSAKSRKSVVTVWDAGEELADSTAAGRRATLYLTDQSGRSLTDDGATLLLATVDWLVGDGEPPSEQPVAAMIVGNTRLGTGDRAMRELAEDVGFRVELIDDDSDIASLDLEQYDLLMISTSVQHPELADVAAERLRFLRIPIVVWEPYLWDDMAMARGVGEGPPTTWIRIEDRYGGQPGHPIVDGLAPGGVAVYTTPAPVSTGPPSGRADYLASDPGSRGMTGTLFANTTFSVDASFDARVMAGPRVGLFVSYDGMSVLTAGGEEIVRKALGWVISDEADPPRAVNDDFVDRLPLDGSAFGMGDYASLEPGEVPPVSHFSRSLWWTWTAPDTGTATFSTGGDAAVAVWSGDALGSLDQIPGGGNATMAHIPVVAGQSYEIAVYSRSVYSPEAFELTVDLDVLALPVPWDFQLIVYEETDATLTFRDGVTRHVRGAMSEAERDEFIERMRIFVEDDLPILSSGSMAGTLQVTIVDEPLSRLEPLFSGFTPTRPNVASEIDSSADAVAVLFEPRVNDVDTGEPHWIGAAAGLAWPRGGRQLYNEFVIDNVVYNAGMRNTNVHKHEYGHSFVFFHEARGFAPLPTVDNHRNDYVNCETGTPYVWVDEFTTPHPHAVPNSIYHNESGFHHDIFSGTTALASDPDRCLGIPPYAWSQAGTPSDLVGAAVAIGSPEAPPLAD